MGTAAWIAVATAWVLWWAFFLLSGIHLERSGRRPHDYARFRSREALLAFIIGPAFAAWTLITESTVSFWALAALVALPYVLVAVEMGRRRGS